MKKPLLIGIILMVVGVCLIGIGKETSAINIVGLFMFIAGIIIIIRGIIDKIREKAPQRVTEEQKVASKESSKRKKLKAGKRIEVPDNHLRPINSQEEILATETYAVLDVETTGLDPATDRIIEIAILKVEDGEPVAKYETLVDPGMAIPPKITKLTGITTDQVRSGKSYQAMCEEVSDFLGSNPIVAHNSVFDARFVSAGLTFFGLDRVFRHIDTVSLAKKAFPDAPNYKLATLIPYLNLTDHEQTHRAMDDVTCTYRLFERCKQTIHANNVLSAELHKASAAVKSLEDSISSVDIFLAYEKAASAIALATEKDVDSAKIVFGTDGQYLENAFSRPITEAINRDFEREKKAIQKLKTRRAILSHIETYKTLFNSNADKLTKRQKKLVIDHEQELIRICDMIAPGK